MSRPQVGNFSCPVCGKVIKAPFKEEQITEHLKTHHGRTPVTRAMKNPSIGKIKG